MRRVKRKETTGNNHRQCLPKKRKESDDEIRIDPFSIIPLDLILEILLKIPTKSVAKLVFVSKRWSSIIQGKHFTMLYMARSSTRPRLLFTVFKTYVNEQFLQICSQENPSSDHFRVNISRHPTRIDDFSPPVHGLICRKYDSNVIIGNPSTGQFLTLPRVNTRRRGVYFFLGYDPVNHVYKVLCMTVLQVRQNRESQVVSEEHQVYTLGAGQNSWRMIVCKHPHLTHPYYTKGGLCINGVLYYYAWIKTEGSLTSFDLISEEFSVIKLPEDTSWIVNYTGKIALRTSHSTGKLDLWVLEDTKRQEWSKVSVLVPSWIDIVHGFNFRGTLSTRELVFWPHSFSNPFYFISYDLKQDTAKKIVVEGVGDQHA